MGLEIFSKIEIDSKATIVLISMVMILSFDESISKTYHTWKNIIRRIFKLF